MVNNRIHTYNFIRTMPTGSEQKEGSCMKAYANKASVICLFGFIACLFMGVLQWAIEILIT
ncbi:MAG: hypothetical protein GY804_04625 [Alphaproteobacteria bacterium]|nr:hypothetical protein [Alphaproteobacteria bacterium]